MIEMFELALRLGVRPRKRRNVLRLPVRPNRGPAKDCAFRAFFLCRPAFCPLFPYIDPNIPKATIRSTLLFEATLRPYRSLSRSGLIASWRFWQARASPPDLLF